MNQWMDGCMNKAREGWMDRYSLVVSPAELRQVGQLLDADDGVVDGRLQTLSHSIGQNNRNHYG